MQKKLTHPQGHGDKENASYFVSGKGGNVLSEAGELRDSVGDRGGKR